MIQVERLKTSELQLKTKCVSQQKQILAMRRALETERSMSVFTSLKSMTTSQEGPSNETILEILNSVQYQIQNVVVALPTVTQTPTLPNLLKKHANLPLLALTFRECLAEGNEPSACQVGSLSALTLNFHDLVMFTTWRVLCDWVFNAEIFLPSNFENPLSAAMLEILTRRGMKC